MDPEKSSMANRLRPIGYKKYLLGTDEQGRDMLSRMLWGGRVSLMMGILPVFFSTLIGGIFGVVAGYYGGKVNMVIMRTMDVFFAFPSVLLAVAIAGSLGGGIGNQMLTLTVVLIPPICRVAETATSQVRALDFVDAARASGASTISILFNHVLINVLVAGAGLFVDPGVDLHHPRFRPLLPRSRRLAADCRLGPDALDAPAVDLRPAARHRHSGRCHPHHLHCLQPRQRRVAPGHGRQSLIERIVR